MEKKLKILTVDDDFINLKLISSMLKRNANIDTIVEATNGLDALNLLKSEGNIDLILLDIKMPIMDGIEISNPSSVYARISKDACYCLNN